MSLAPALVAATAALAAAGPAERFYTPPDSPAARQARAWERAGRERDAALMRALAQVPKAVWLTSGTPREARRAARRTTAAAAREGAIPVLVTYNVPNRECTGGGARDYRAWIGGVARGIARRRAWVVVEPDALAQSCGARHVARAVRRLAQLPRTRVYVDAGHSHWQPVTTMTRRLRRAAIGRADGFALNVSNFRRTRELVAYGTRLSRALGGAHFVLDTSRNGRGPWHGRQDWCNPPGRGLGARPTTATQSPLVDAHLWVKVPGESDGACAGGHDPAAGAWWPRYALGLARRARPPLPPLPSPR